MSTVANPPHLETSTSPATARVPNSRDRISALDGLRGVAAFGVMLYHFTWAYDEWYHFPKPLSFSVAGLVMLRYGVHLFFLISGFVIFMTIERSKTPMDFVRSRFSRLYPAYWLSMAIALAVLLSHIGPPATVGPFEPRTTMQTLRRALINITMVQNWFRIGSINWVYWTLQVEMSFYAIMLFLLWKRWVRWTVPIMAGVVVFGGIDAYVYRHWPNPVSPWIRGWLALDWIHIMTLGIVIYKMRLQPRLAYIPVIALCLVAPWFNAKPWDQPGEQAMIVSGLALIIYLATKGYLPFLASRPFVFMGAISYSLYLNHELIGDSIIYQLTRRGVMPELAIVSAYVTTILLATAITFAFERPIGRLLRPRKALSTAPHSA